MPRKKSIGFGAKNAAWERVRFKKGMFSGVEELFKKKGLIVGEINSSTDPTKTYLKYLEAGTVKALFSPHERRCMVMALIGRKKRREAKINTKATELELEEILRRMT